MDTLFPTEPVGTWESTKRFSGFSTCFRQWRATESHCHLLHGYGMTFDVVFAGPLDCKNWVMDFGAFHKNGLKKKLQSWFDHTTIIAEDDPELSTFVDLEKKGLINLRTMPNVGCEIFAQHVFHLINKIVADETHGRVFVQEVRCVETENNSATFSR